MTDRHQKQENTKKEKEDTKEILSAKIKLMIIEIEFFWREKINVSNNDDNVFIIIIESHHVIILTYTNNKLIELSNIDQKQPHHNEEIKIFREKKPPEL